MTDFNAQDRGRLAHCDGDSPLGGIHLFVVIGAQRTGTNILREILNTNDQIAMLGEVLSASTAPAHWDNFCRGLPLRSVHPESSDEAAELLDRYLEFVRYRIRNHWEGNRKSRSHAIGLDIKYNQLTHIAPTNWDSTLPFMLSYLRSRGATLIHATRNVVHSAISTLIASQRDVWHNYNGAVVEHSYHLDVRECLALARTISRDRNAFLEWVYACKVVNCHYENLIDDLARAGSGEVIPEAAGPLRDIAVALRSSFNFRNERRLQKAINVSYSRLISNHDALVRSLADSEFAALASTLD